MVVGLDLILAVEQPFELLRRAARSSDPGDSLHGRFLSPAELEERYALGPRTRAPLLEWLRDRGLHPVAADDPWRLRVHATVERLREALGPEVTAALGTRNGACVGLPFSTGLPVELRGLVTRIDVARDPVEPWRKRRTIVPRAATDSGPNAPHALTPAWLRRALEVPERLGGGGEHIMIMALGGEPRADDLGVFAQSFGLGCDPIHVVECGPVSEQARRDPMARHETTMLLQWSRAMAPRARITVAFIDPHHVADPWAAFYEAALAERSPAVTVALTSWSSPERQHYRVHGREVSTLRIAQLAALGCSMVAASGDWGVVEGFPATKYQAHRVCGIPWPGVSYPACEPGVLGVGGTVGFGEHARCLRSRLSDDLVRALPVDEIASSGGFSDAVPAPPWQAPHLASAYARTGDQPAVVPGGRGVPDVSMPAWGTPATNTDDPGHGYWGRIDGRWRDDIGGTSLGAALWGAVLALANEALTTIGRPRVGWVTPQLYRLADRAPDVLRSVVQGTTVMTVPTVGPDGEVRASVIPGYRATAGWDPATGLGLPRVGPLIEALSGNAGSRRY